MNDDCFGDLPQTPEEMRQRLPELSNDQKVAYAHKAILPYSYYDQVFAEIDECRRIRKFRTEPPCLFVGGRTNTGKTTIAEKYEKKYPKETLKDRNISPVLYVRMKSPPTDSTVCDQVLLAISPAADLRGRTTLRTGSLEGLLKDGRTEVLILDEVQGFYRNKRVETTLALSDWIKDLSGNAHIVIVLIGIPKAENLFSLNEQLSRRFPRRIMIQPFSYDSDEREKEFNTTLGDADYAMPFQVPANLDSPDMASRICYSSNGYIGFVSDLIRGAAILGLDRGSECITRELLAESFMKTIQNHFPFKINPFQRKKFSRDQALEMMKAERLKAEEAERRKKLKDEE